MPSQPYYIKSITDPNGLTTTFQYNSNSLLTKITDGYGREVNFTYNADKKIQSITDSLGRVTYLYYSSQSLDLLRVVDPEGKTSLFQYNTNHQIVGKTDKAGNVFTFSYSSGKPIGAKDSAGKPLLSLANSNYWAVDNTVALLQNLRQYLPATTTKTDGRGNHWRYSYDKNGFITQSTAPDGAVASYTYDPAVLKLSSATDANGHATQYQYDAKGNIVKVTDALGYVSLYEYHPIFNHPTKSTDPQGTITQNVYDAHGNRSQETRDAGGLNLVTTWTYDSQGHVLTQTDPNGHTTTYEYDGHGNQTKATDPEGHVTQYEYNAVGLKTKMIDGNGYATLYAYDGMNRLLTATDPLGYVTAYAYDGQGEHIQISKQVSLSPASYEITQYQHDNRNRLIKEIRDPGTSPHLNLTTSYTYDNNDNRIAITDPRGKQTQYAYDTQNRLATVTDALGNATQTQYDPVGNRTCAIDANGHYSYFEYDALNRASKQTRKIGAQSCTTADGNDILTQTFYDSGNAIAQATCNNSQCAGPIPGSTSPAYSIDPDNKFSYFKYDKTNRRVMTIRKVGDTNDSKDSDDWAETIQYDAASNVLVRTDANGNPTTNTYFNNNLPKNNANALGDTTTYTYDNANNLKTTTTPGGNVVTNTYNARNELIQVDDLIGRVVSYAYDGIGNRLQQCDGNNNCTAHQYDLVNRLTKTTDAMAQASNYSYDPDGNLIKTLDREGKAACYKYDDINRRIRQVQKVGDTDCNAGGGDGDANDVWTKTVYDAVGNVTELTTAKNNGGGTPAVCNGGSPTPDCQTTRYIYDEVNRLVQETYPDAGIRYFAYDPKGNLIQRTDQKGQVTDYQFNDLDYLTARLYSADNNDSFTYDVGGRMLIACREGTIDNVPADGCAGWIVTYNYDAANRVLHTAQNGKNVNYAYDIPNRKRTVAYPGGKTVVEQRDLRERLGNLNSGGIATYTYDLANRVTIRVYGNGTQAAYSYNANNWITDLNHTKADTTLIAGFAHAYDNEGNKRYEDKAHDTNHSEGYSYDDLYRLMNYKVGTLDGAGQILLPLTQTQYDLDKLGNWDSKTVTPQVGPVVTENRQHNAVNEITAVDLNPPVTHQQPSYDANGNWIDDDTLDGGYTYVYDQENRLTQVNLKAPSELAGRYVYDALSRRIAKTSGPSRGNSETRYVYDDARIIEEQNNAGTTQASYSYGNYIDEVLTMDRSGTTYYYHQNALWSVEALTDGTAAVVERVAYDAYGMPTITDGSGTVLTNAWGTARSGVGNPWLFTGRQFDEESGIYFYRARYYDPGKGRFLQRDPMEYRAGLNHYAYVIDNPINWADPLGLKLCISKLISGKKFYDQYKTGTLDKIDMEAWATPDNTSLTLRNYTWAIGYYVLWYREGIVDIKTETEIRCSEEDGKCQVTVSTTGASEGIDSKTSAVIATKEQKNTAGDCIEIAAAAAGALAAGSGPTITAGKEGVLSIGITYESAARQRTMQLGTFKWCCACESG